MAPRAGGTPRSALRPLPALIGWLALISTWGLLGAQLDINGPTLPPTAPFLAFAALFIVSVVAAAPIGFIRRASRPVELLLWAAIAAVALEFWYVVMTFASTDPTSDDAAAAFVMLSAVPVWALLLLPLLGGWGIGRLRLRRRTADAQRSP